MPAEAAEIRKLLLLKIIIIKKSKSKNEFQKSTYKAGLICRAGLWKKRPQWTRLHVFQNGRDEISLCLDEIFPFSTLAEKQWQSAVHVLFFPRSKSMKNEIANIPFFLATSHVNFFHQIWYFFQVEKNYSIQIQSVYSKMCVEER